MAGAAGGFVTRAFDAMLKECSGKKYTSLQSAIQSYLDGVKEGNQQTEVSEALQKSEHTYDESHGQSSVGDEQVVKPARTSVSIAIILSNVGHKLEGAQAELVLNPLRLAFETKNIKVVEPALDCLHKLIAYDHLEGDPGVDDGENAALFADILSIVCSCVDNSSDSTILQVLKVLLTAVASTKFRVHGEPLLGVIRACYNIYLNSKSPMNQITSKAMLTQMISIIFRKMESDPTFSNVLEELHDQSSSESISHTEDGSISGSKTGVEGGSVDNQNGRGIIEADAAYQKSVKDASITSIEELLNLAGGADMQGLEAIMDKAVNFEDVNKIKNDIDLENMTIGHRDALLVFRTLCKMGMKEGGDDIATKTRILSLEILQALLEGVSDALTKNFHLISSVKACLSYALLRASVSSSPVIFQHTAGIFAVLLLRFRENLKGEIGILFPLIVLRYLDNADNQRISVLRFLIVAEFFRMLEKVCKDPQMLIDLYVNYDCDLSAPNLSERMVKTLSKIAQGTHFSDPNSVAATQNDSVKNSALQCLVNMLKSLVNRERSRKESEKRNTGRSSLGNELSDAAEKKARVEVSSDFEKAKAHKSTMESAIAEFNRQPGKGIEYLVANKLVENTPTSVAEFLKTTSNLDKALVGDYLGQHEEFPRSVMHAYVDSMNFSGMKFDAAIREFLTGFRFPREAQKIDRIVEKFSERYCADNPSLFGNADTAYVLAYAVLILNTNAHNPTVSSKMSKTDFIHMNSTEAEEVPPKELLEDIYDSIVNEEIKLNDDPGSTAISVRQKPEVDERGLFISILNLTLPRRKSVDKKSESDAIIKQTQSIFRNQGAKWGMFYTSHKVELIRPMVEAVGWSLLATFSVIMEEGDNKSRILLCMEGFKAGIHITHVLEMDTMRYAFLTSLVRFTFLHAPKNMRSKNVEALRTLLELCESDTNSLMDSWNAVLECISRLEFITSSPSISATVGANQNPRDAVVPSLRELAEKPTEQVFLNTTKLPSGGIVEFFTALCGISAEELKQTPARLFSLQKLVEISYYNMARIRLVWARIWVVLSNHFVSAGSHHDEKVALYAIDSLRQLGMKYLERVELANFTFQNDILKPFVALMRNSRRETTKRLIIDCVVQMINSKVATIKSGWRSVFMIFMAAADDESETIVESAFENVEQVILEHFDQVIGECFLDCVNCLIGFANNKSSDRTSLKAIALLRIYENHLAEGLVPGGALNLINKSRDEEFDVTEHYWFPMLAGLSDLTSDTRAEVRNCALEVLFDLLNERGSKFSSSFWESIFRRVLFPIFDHVRHAGKGTSQFSSDDEWLHETCIHSLQLLCNLFNTFYKEVSFMLPPLLSLLLDCAKKTDQSVVSIALGALVHLIDVGGHQFSDNDWGTLLKSIRDASYATQPLELLNDLGFQHANMPTHLGDTKPDGGDGVVNATGYDPIQSRKVDNHEAVSMSHPDHNNDDDSLQSSASGSSSPSVSSQKPTDSDLQRNQTLGQRIMGNRFLRSFTSKQKDQELNGSVQSLAQLPDAVEDDSKDEEESPLLTSIRGKCVTQLLLLSAIDSIQKKYWSKLKGQQKVTIMEILVSMLDFAASYNSYANLRLRMHHIPVERPPMNLLRQELVGTCVYLDILQKTISALEDTKRENSPEVSDFRDLEAEPKLGQVAEEKMVSFCGHVLKDASDFQSSVKGTTNMEIHRVLELRSPIIVKVINGMSSMNSQIFKKHLGEFYPLLTKLLCCDQMAIRGALGDLFRNQLSSLLP